MLRGVEAYAEEVRTRKFPGPEHTYGIAPEELDRFRADIARRAGPRPGDNKAVHKYTGRR